MPRRQVQVGEGGRTLGALRPTGHVEIGGLRYEARSLGEFVPADTPVIVEKVEVFCLIVRAQQPGDSPLYIREDRDNRGVQEHAARQEELAARRRRARDAVTAVGLGLLLGLALYVWLRHIEGRPADWKAIAFAGWGALLGLGYLLFLRIFLASARDVISENITPTPGVWLLIVLPLAGGLMGAVGGYELNGEPGAIVGAVVVAFVLPPLGCLTWYLLITLMETGT
jgi:hypothetical protein